MAERLKTKLLDSDKEVDIVCGPDAYRSLPYLIDFARGVEDGVADVMLSADETYADIMPIRIDESSRAAYVSIMRLVLRTYAKVDILTGCYLEDVTICAHSALCLRPEELKEVDLLRLSWKRSTC
jgi:tRNA A37 methylthiotransferase MiaB